MIPGFRTRCRRQPTVDIKKIKRRYPAAEKEEEATKARDKDKKKNK